MPKRVVVGLDLSLRAPAACSIPVTWAGDLRDVMVEHWGSDLRQDANEQQRADRIEANALRALAFVRGQDPELVAIEQYAFAMSGSHSREVAEQGGVVKYLLKTNNYRFVSVVASRARKVLLQRLPRREVKAFTMANVRRLVGTERWTEDEIDAFVICNYGVMVCGGVALTFEGVDVEKKNR